MTPTRTEAAERLLDRVERYTNAQFANKIHADLNDALAAEREPLLAALKALVDEVEAERHSGGMGLAGHSRETWDAKEQARALIEQDGRREQ